MFDCLLLYAREIHCTPVTQPSAGRLMCVTCKLKDAFHISYFEFSLRRNGRVSKKKVHLDRGAFSVRWKCLVTDGSTDIQPWLPHCQQQEGFQDVWVPSNQESEWVTPFLKAGTHFGALLAVTFQPRRLPQLSIMLNCNSSFMGVKFMTSIEIIIPFLLSPPPPFAQHITFFKG